MDFKRCLNVISSFVGFMSGSATQASAVGVPATFMESIQDVEELLLQVGSALGIFMIAFGGLKWVTAQSPQERENAKKMVIYVMIGLVLLKGSENIVSFLLT